MFLLRQITYCTHGSRNKTIAQVSDLALPGCVKDAITTDNGSAPISPVYVKTAL